jgi:hypothetical protein
MKTMGLGVRTEIIPRGTQMGEGRFKIHHKMAVSKAFSLLLWAELFLP